MEIEFGIELKWCWLKHPWSNWEDIDDETQSRHCFSCNKKEWNRKILKPVKPVKPEELDNPCKKHGHKFGKWNPSVAYMYQRRECKICGYTDEESL